MPKQGSELLRFLLAALKSKKYKNLMWIDSNSLMFAIITMNKHNKNCSQFLSLIYEDWSKIKSRKKGPQDKRGRFFAALKRSKFLNQCTEKSEELSTKTVKCLVYQIVCFPKKTSQDNVAQFDLPSDFPELCIDLKLLPTPVDVDKENVCSVGEENMSLGEQNMSLGEQNMSIAEQIFTSSLLNLKVEDPDSDVNNAVISDSEEPPLKNDVFLPNCPMDYRSERSLSVEQCLSPLPELNSEVSLFNEPNQSDLAQHALMSLEGESDFMDDFLLDEHFLDLGQYQGGSCLPLSSDNVNCDLGDATLAEPLDSECPLEANGTVETTLMDGVQEGFAQEPSFVSFPEEVEKNSAVQDNVAVGIGNLVLTPANGTESLNVTGEWSLYYMRFGGQTVRCMIESCSSPDIDSLNEISAEEQPNPSLGLI